MKLLDGVDSSQLFGLPAPDIATLDDGLQVPFVQTGHEHHEVMLFVHGSLCDFRYWKPQLGPLGRQYRCVAPSLSHYWPSGCWGLVRWLVDQGSLVGTRMLMSWGGLSSGWALGL